MRSPESYASLYEWALSSCAQAADDLGVGLPGAGDSLGGVEPIHMAAELLALAEHDASELLDHPGLNEALEAIQDALDGLLGALQTAGSLRAGFCLCGEHVGLTEGGHLRDCPICDYCDGCGQHEESCDCDCDFDDCDDDFDDVEADHAD